MGNAADALETLRRLADTGELDEFCAARGIDLLVVFGSAINGAVAEPRDLDIAILAPEAAGVEYFSLVADLIALLHSDAVDVMDLSGADVLARSEALGWGQPLYERKPGLFAEEQMRAMGQRMESGWLLDLQLQALGRP